MTERRQVLITRPEGDAVRTAYAVQRLGYEPVCAPFLRIAHAAPTSSVGFQAVLAASGNALPGLTPSATPLLAVGAATAQRARDAGFSNVQSADGDGDALLALALQVLDPAGGTLLLACGERHGHVLADALAGRGFTVERRVTYASEPVERFPEAAASCIRSSRLHAALFLSGQTAAAFARALPAALAPALHESLAVAIGNLAADALKPLPWRQIRQARTPTLDDVLALL